MTTIADKIRLSPTQMRTVAGRRLADARCLASSGRNQHANGALYLAGYVVECLLKAMLIEKHRWLKQPPGDLTKRSKRDKELYELCYRKHDIAGLVDNLLPLSGGQYMSEDELLTRLRKIGGEWTVHVRYSTLQVTMKEAQTFIGGIQEVAKCLK